MYFPVGDSCDGPAVQTVSLVMEDDELLTLSEAQDVVTVVAGQPVDGEVAGRLLSSSPPACRRGAETERPDDPGCGRVAPLP